MSARPKKLFIASVGVQVKPQFSLRALLILVFAVCIVLPFAIDRCRRFIEYQHDLRAQESALTDQLRVAKTDVRYFEVRLDVDARLMPAFEDASEQVHTLETQLRELNSWSWRWLFE